MSDVNNVIYTALTHTTGDRQNGAARSSDGRLDIRFAAPCSTAPGTNPEQLFAAGWSACFHGAMGLAAHRLKLTMPQDTSIDAEVDLCLTGGAYFLRAKLHVSLPEMPRDAAQKLIEAAHETCPYSKAIRGNVEAKVALV